MGNTIRIINPHNKVRMRYKRLFIVLMSAFVVLSTLCVVFADDNKNEQRPAEYVYKEWENGDLETDENKASDGTQYGAKNAKMGADLCLLALQMMDRIMYPDKTERDRLSVSVSVGKDGNVKVKDVAGLASETKDSAEIFGNVSGTLSDILTIARNIALILAICTFFIGFMTTFMEQGAVGDDTVVRKLAVLGVTIAGVVLIGTVTAYVLDIGTGVMNSFFGSLSNSGSEREALIRVEEQMMASCTRKEELLGLGVILSNFGKSVSYICTLLIPWLIALAAYVVVSVVCWARALECLVLIALAPFSLIDISSNRFSERFMRFLRQVFAIALQGAIIVFVIGLVGLMMTSVFSTSLASVASQETGNVVLSFGSFFTIIILSITKITLATKSRQLAQTIVGA